MAYIYLQPGQTHGEVNAKLTALGGARGVDFEYDFAWDGEILFAVTDELHEKWVAALRDARKDGDTPDTSGASRDPASDNPEGTSQQSAGDDAKDGAAADEKPGEPEAEADPTPDETSDSPGAAGTDTASDADKANGSSDADGAGATSSNSTSGTTKRSGATKNGSRRS